MNDLTPHHGGRGADLDAILGAFNRLVAGFNVYDDAGLKAKLALLAEGVEDEPLWAIEQAVKDFINGRVKRKRMDVMPGPWEFAPHVRSLREAAARRREEAASRPPPSGRAYAYARPRSAILEERITSDMARQLCRNGVHPGDSIWIPGNADDRPDLGDLFAPDPSWKAPTPILTKEELADRDERRAADERWARRAGGGRSSAEILRAAGLKMPGEVKPQRGQPHAARPNEKVHASPAGKVAADILARQASREPPDDFE